MNHTGTVTLNTERLTLRKFNHKDAKDVFQNYFNDERVTTNILRKPHESIEATQKLLNDYISSYQQDDVYHWAIEYDGAVIGEITATGHYANSFKLGACIGYNYWNRGFVTEAMREVIHFLFEKVGANRIFSSNGVHNPASGRIQEKCGMLYEGLMRDYILYNDEYYDVTQYAILKRDYCKST